jgi:hypothetical protein
MFQDHSTGKTIRTQDPGNYRRSETAPFPEFSHPVQIQSDGISTFVEKDTDGRHKNARKILSENPDRNWVQFNLVHGTDSG